MPPRVRSALVRVRWPEVALGKVSLLLVALLVQVGRGDCTPGHSMWMLATVSTLMLLGYLANDAADQHDDRAVGKRNAFASSRPAAVRTTIVLLAATALCLLSRYGATIRALGAAQIATGLAYSLPPLRLKGRGAVGLAAAFLSQYFICPVIVLAGWPEAGGVIWGSCLGVLGVGGAALELGHQRHDRERDRAVGVATFASRLPRGAIDSAYGALLSVLGVLYLAAPIAVLLAVDSGGGAPQGALVVGTLWVTGLLAIAAARHVAREGIGSVDPFYASRGDVMDRLYTYLPNGFAVVVAGAAASVATTSPMPGAIAVIWVLLSMPWASPPWHAAEWARLALPPELRRPREQPGARPA